MSQLIIRQLLEVRLNTIASPLPTAYENVPFKPTPRTAYQKVHLLPAATENPAYGDNVTVLERESGVFQVTLMYPENEGAANATTRAESIRALFPRGLVLTSGAVRLRIDRSPSVASAFPDNGYFSLPVSVFYTADVYRTV